MPQTRRAPQGSGLDALEWRLIGPYRAGRVVAVAGHPAQRQVYYMGSTGGGVWKTTDGGVYWRNMSDGFFKRASVGALAVAVSDPNVIYAGMGEACIRGNVSHGDGVYRSTDAGRTWTHLGLENTRNIGKLRVDPHDPDLVYVAALGHAHGPNIERGVFRSRDGGKTWKRVLSRGDRAGAIDFVIDPTNPRILYASFWEAVRNPWSLTSGGPGSGLFRSTDGGDSWSELHRNPGFPRGVLGKIGISVAASRPERIYAVVEAADGAVFRSDDSGARWTRLSEDRNLRQRAWYYHHIYADPIDAETVWVLNVDVWRSSDAGKTFEIVTVPHGDNHDLWIDPADPLRMIEGNDGGAIVTYDGADSWSSVFNQPTSEMYHVSVDTRIPYRVYGSQQDNTSISLPSRSPLAGITRNDYEAIGGGEAGYIAIRPDDPNIVYAGDHQGHLTRYDFRTGQARVIDVWPEAASGWSAGVLKYRFNWTAPTVLSPHDPTVLYQCGNHVFRSRDEGGSWELASPDLSRNDPKTLGDSGGPITKDQTGAEFYGTVFTFAESPVKRGVLWAGTDDGLIHVSRDDGAHWTNVTPKALAKWSLVSLIDASPHDAGAAYAAIDRHKLDDFRPYLYRTRDYGRTWTKITTGIPADSFTRAIREDPEHRGLLYAGTETGVYVSMDNGAHWERWQGKGLPVVPIHDLVVKDTDLVLATHGRSFWIFDDISPVRQLAAKATSGNARLFTPRLTTRFKVNTGFGGKPKPGKNYRHPGATQIAYTVDEDPKTGDKVERYLDGGKNPPDGVIVTYWLRSKATDEVKLTFLDSRGREIRSFSSRVATPDAPSPEASAQPAEGAESVVEPETKEPKVPVEAGMNRFVWNMRYPDATRIEGDPYMDELARALAGPVAAPGRYRVRLDVPGTKLPPEEFEIRADPRTGATRADLEAQFVLGLKVRDELSRIHDGINRLRLARAQIGLLMKRDRRLISGGMRLRRALAEVEGQLIQPLARSRQDTLNFGVRMNERFAALGGVVGSADAAPTKQSLEVYAILKKRTDGLISRLDSLLASDLRALESRVRSSGAAVARARAAKRGSRRTRPGAR